MAKETKEVVEFLLTLGEAVGMSFQDGKISLGDAVYLFDTVQKIGPALSDIGKIPAELAAWQEADSKELIALAADFDIPQDSIEAVVKDAIKIAVPVIEFLAKFRRE